MCFTVSGHWQVPQVWFVMIFFYFCTKADLLAGSSSDAVSIDSVVHNPTVVSDPVNPYNDVSEFQTDTVHSSSLVAGSSSDAVSIDNVVHNLTVVSDRMNPDEDVGEFQTVTVDSCNLVAGSSSDAWVSVVS